MKVAILGLLMAAGALSACTEPMATSHQHVTSDGQHWAVQVSMHTGEMGTPQQTVMVMYNKWQKTPIAVVKGQTKVLSDKLVDAFLNLGPAVVGGHFLIKAAEADCPPGTLCGTLVQVSNNANSVADSNATSNQKNRAFNGS